MVPVLVRAPDIRCLGPSAASWAALLAGSAECWEFATAPIKDIIPVVGIIKKAKRGADHGQQDAATRPR